MLHLPFVSFKSTFSFGTMLFTFVRKLSDLGSFEPSFGVSDISVYSTLLSFIL